MRIQFGPRAKAALLLALVGTLGVLVGIGLDRLVASPAPPGMEMPARQHDGPREGPSRDRRAPDAWGRGFMPGLRFSERMAEELELTAQQKVAIDSIMAENRVRVRALMREYQPRFREIVAETRRELDAVLTEEQRERARELMEERRTRRSR